MTRRQAAGPLDPGDPGGQLAVVAAAEGDAEGGGEVDGRRRRVGQALDGRRARSRIRSLAAAGCSDSAENRVTDFLTTAAWMPGQNRPVSSAVVASPVTSTIGTP